MPQCSLVIPLFNEAESLPELHAWIKRVCESHAISYEILFIDDGSKDKTAQVVKQYNDNRIRYVYQTNAERSTARNNGIFPSSVKYTPTPRFTLVARLSEL